MKSILLVPFHERGYRKLARYLEETSSHYTVYLPLPLEFCRKPVLDERIFTGLSGYIRVWSSVLEALRSCENCVCYLTLDYFEKTLDFSVKLVGLVLKAKIFEKINPSEWLNLLPEKIEPKVPTTWSGVLVVDRFIDYAVLVKKNVEFDYVSQLESFIPTPLDLLLLIRSGLIKWNCDISDIIKWVVRYLGDYVLTSRDLTGAYDRLVKSEEYLNLIHECTNDPFPLLAVLHYSLNMSSKPAL